MIGQQQMNRMVRLMQELHLNWIQPRMQIDSQQLFSAMKPLQFQRFSSVASV